MLGGTCWGAAAAASSSQPASRSSLALSANLRLPPTERCLQEARRRGGKTVECPSAQRAPPSLPARPRGVPHDGATNRRHQTALHQPHNRHILLRQSRTNCSHRATNFLIQSQARPRQTALYKQHSCHILLRRSRTTKCGHRATNFLIRHFRVCRRHWRNAAGRLASSRTCGEATIRSRRTGRTQLEECDHVGRTIR